ncbi:hypothetical protein D3C86_2050220 [compost metagenome]
MLALPQCLHLAIAVVQLIAVAAVGVERQRAVLAGISAGIGHGQHVPRIDVAVVRQHIAGDRVRRVVLADRVGIGHCGWRMVVVASEV